jgi:hypothetical protein
VPGRKDQQKIHVLSNPFEGGKLGCYCRQVSQPIKAEQVSQYAISAKTTSTPVTKNLIQLSVRRLAGLILPLILTSCALQEKGPQIDPFAAINPLQKFNPLAPQSPLAGAVVAQWETDFAKPGFLDTAGGYWHTRQGRDELVYRLIFMCDYRFSRYEADLVAGKATRDTVIDLAVLGLTSAAALTTPGQATQILAAIAGGLVGSRAAIEKNFYQNLAQPVLLRKMQVLRQQKILAISDRLRKYNVDVYPTERALIDVLDYYNRGTMLAALQEISNDTAAQEIELRGGAVAGVPIKRTSLQLDTNPRGNDVPIDRKPLESSPTPKPRPEPTSEKVHILQKKLIKQLANISDQQATEILAQFAPPGFPTLPEPKTRLQVLISDTFDLAKLTKIGEKTPLPPPEPTRKDIHGLQRELIKGLDNISDQDAMDILDQFAPPTFAKAGIPKTRLQVLISDTFDFVTLSKMGEKIPH